MRFLLDVNVLFAIAFPDHASHSKAYNWFRREPNRKWASCPLTQAGFLRQMTRSLGPSHAAFRLALDALEADCKSPNHEYWPIDIDLRELTIPMRERILGPNQITDLQLLLLAHKHHGQLATLDNGIRELAAGTRYANSITVI